MRICKYTNLSKKMISLTLIPFPILTVGNETFRGINILEKLYEIRHDSPVAEKMFEQIATTY